MLEHEGEGSYPALNVQKPASNFAVRYRYSRKEEIEQNNEDGTPEVKRKGIRI